MDKVTCTHPAILWLRVGGGFLLYDGQKVVQEMQTGSGPGLEQSRTELESTIDAGKL
jgi:hypothetical protein